MSYYNAKPRWTPRPDNMTQAEHDAILAEYASKNPCPSNSTGTALATKLTEVSTQKDRVAFLKHMLATNLAWATKGAQQIHKLQTESEKSTAATTDSNSVGWSGYDAKGMTWICNWINKQTERGVSLATAVNKPKAIRKLHKIMPKYASQLLKIVNGKITLPVEKVEKTEAEQEVLDESYEVENQEVLRDESYATGVRTDDINLTAFRGQKKKYHPFS